MALDAGTALERPVLRFRRNEDYYFTLRAIAANANIKHRFRAVAKTCCVPILVLLVIAALGPEKWAPRTHLGWQFDHFIGYFGITLTVSDRGSLRGNRGTARGPASLHAGSVSLSSGHILRCSRGAGGGSHC